APVLRFSLRFIVNLSAFWLLDYRGILNVTTLTWTFLAGFVIPLNFLPEGPRAVLEALPFAGILQVPIDVFLGKRLGLDLLGALIFQAAWAAALLPGGRLLAAAAVRRLVVQGGGAAGAAAHLPPAGWRLDPGTGPVPADVRARLCGAVRGRAVRLPRDPRHLPSPAATRRLVAARGGVPVRNGGHQLRADRSLDRPARHAGPDDPPGNLRRVPAAAARQP